MLFSCPPLPLPFLWILLFAFCFWAACFWLFLVEAVWRPRRLVVFLLGVFLGEFLACLRPLSTFVDASFVAAFTFVFVPSLFLLFACLAVLVAFLFLFHVGLFLWWFFFLFFLWFFFGVVCRACSCFLWSWSLCAAHVLSPLLFLGVVFYCVPALFSFGVFCCVPVFIVGSFGVAGIVCWFCFGF